MKNPTSPILDFVLLPNSCEKEEQFNIRPENSTLVSNTVVSYDINPECAR